VFSDPRNAASHMRNTLPAAVVDRLDLDALAQRPGSFVDDDLRSRQTDLLFEAPFRNGDGKAFVYLLVEHQSRPDPLMPLRLLRYMLRIWDKLLTEDDQRRRLPPIVPMVLHHSAEGWRAPVAFGDLYDGPADALEALGPHLPRFQFYLMDLSAIPDHALRGTAMAQVTYLLLKHARDGDLEAKLAAWSDLLRTVAAERTSGLQALQLVVQYVVQAGGLAVDALHRVTRHVHPDMSQIIETTADRLRTEGRREGLEEGRREGLEEGRREGLEEGLQQGFEQGQLEASARNVVRALEARGVVLPNDVRERILACRDADALDRWFDRAVVVAAVADLFTEDK
jgi:predicted transposase/invertase (TIGR01784 family)